VVGLSADETLPLCARETTLTPDQAAAGLADLSARTVAYVRRAMPRLEPAPVGFRLCHITALAGDPTAPATAPGDPTAPGDSDAFAAWERGAITVFAGHNVMKFAPLIGELLAGRIVDGEPAAGLPRR
jgi:sarcosine oxidase